MNGRCRRGVTLGPIVPQIWNRTKPATIIKAGCLGLFLVLLLRALDWSQFAVAVRRSHWQWLPALWFCSLAVGLLRTYRQAVICEISWRDSITATGRSLWAQIVLPDVVSVPVKWNILSKYIGRWKHTVTAAIYGQVVQYVVHFVLLMLVARIALDITITSLGYIGAVASAVIALGIVTHYARVKDRIPQSILYYIRKPLWWHGVVVLLDGLMVGIQWLFWLLACLAANVSIPIAVALFAYSVTVVASKSLPGTYGDLGVREAVVAWICYSQGAGIEAAVLISALMRSTRILQVVIALLYLAIGRSR